MNYNRITDRLIVGTTPGDFEPSGRNALEDFQRDLAKLDHDENVTHIINCREELDIGPMLKGTVYDNTSYPSHPRYLHNGTADWNPLKPEHKQLDWFQSGLGFALPVLAKPNGVIYCFCKAGANRSATMAWTILRALGLTRGECFAIIDTHRFIDIVGLIECGWWKDGEAAVISLRYVR